jgi:LacI family transcriptional regulator
MARARRTNGSRATIGVVLSTEMDCWREVLRGVSTFVMKSGELGLELFTPLEDFVELIRAHDLDGLLLGPVPDVAEARASIAAVDGPVVGVVADYHVSQPEVPVLASVESDDEQVGAVAARHFLDKGYRHFAFLGTPARWSDRRRTGFERTLTAAGNALVTLIHGGPLANAKRGWPLPHYGPEVYEWLRQLPRPVAILACNDLRARELAELCRAHGVHVPEDVAILGVDNDDLECAVAYPPLSSVAVPWRQIGFVAAEVLASALKRRKPRAKVIRVPPEHVVERQSTDTIAISDPDVSAAIRFIRDNAHRVIGVDDVLAAVPAARRSLEKRFKATLGRSPLDEIRRAHVERAKRLLSQTDLPMAGIADGSGFASAAWFSKTFHDVAGETPSQYRARFALR